MQSLADLAAAERYLESLINLEKNPEALGRRVSTAPIAALLEKIGNPQRSFSVLHIAGSKGKGSTALFSESLLRAAGKRVGTFTSPHLEHWTERFRIGGSDVDPEALVDEVERLRPHVERQRKESAAPLTFFDVTTALAFALFRRFSVTHGVVEVGLGGRLDSTNVVTASVSCITSIELEHTDRLGETHEEIAGEKAGILKGPFPALLGPLLPAARDVIVARAAVVGALVSHFGEDFGVDRSLDPAELFDGAFRVPFRTELLGEHVHQNAALALACVRRLPGVGFSEQQAADALRETRLPGRLELLGEAPTLLVDSAHTAASAKAARRVMLELPHHERWLVLSMSSGKDLRKLCEILLPGSHRVVVTRAEPHRSVAALALAREVERWLPTASVRVVPDPEEALAWARAQAGSRDLVCAVGSVYLAGIARRMFRETPAPAH